MWVVRYFHVELTKTLAGRHSSAQMVIPVYVVRRVHWEEYGEYTFYTASARSLMDRTNGLTTTRTVYKFTAVVHDPGRNYHEYSQWSHKVYGHMKGERHTKTTSFVFYIRLLLRREVRFFTFVLGIY